MHPIVRARGWILAAFVALCVWLLPGIGRLGHDDDVLAFLPPAHPDVQAFRKVAERFGMLDVALVGLQTDADLLSPDQVELVRTLARTTGELPGVGLVLSFPDFPDVEVRGETLHIEPLVPPGLEDAEAIRSRVLANPNAVGNVVSASAEAAALLVFLLDVPAEQRVAHLHSLREHVEERWPAAAYFGGAPFIEMEAARSSRADLERLSPLVIAVLGFASALLLRSLSGALVNLAITGLGVGLVVGAHGHWNEPFSIVSATTPVLMVALGGAFGMHIIAAYQRQNGSPPMRASAALRDVGWPVVLSGTTTAVAFFALVVMPQVPMRRFGIAAGLAVMLIMVLALAVLPAVLGCFPDGWLKTRSRPPLPLRWVPPTWALVAAAAIGAVAVTRLRADPDTRNVFAQHSEPWRADRFFERYFGGSQFVQIAVEADLTDPVALREIRSIADEVGAIEGVAEVRSLIDPVAILTEGFGGRRGLPQTLAQGRRVITQLADQSLMRQLMTIDGRAAMIHVKLAPGDVDDMQTITDRVRDIASRYEGGALWVASTSDPRVAATQRDDVRKGIAAAYGGVLEPATFDTIAGEAAVAAIRSEIERLRARAFGSDELIEPLPAKAYADLGIDELQVARGPELEQLIRTKVPQLATDDPRGVEVVAQQLGSWIDEAVVRARAGRLCDALGIAAAVPTTDGAEFDDDAPQLGTRCRELGARLDELGDPRWAVGRVDGAEPIEFRVNVTGQPILGHAFAQSVERSLWISTAVSAAALTLVLLLVRLPLALVPAVWTLTVTFGILAALGHSISVGTSMIACVALGAGVDFGIHLGFRARRERSEYPGSRATDALGRVVIATGFQLALAFCVLGMSSMPPLRDFGFGLAIALLGAALGAVWLTPRLYDRRRGAKSGEN